MSKPGNQYWFPVKESGWGWSAPSVWQGWLVVAVYCVLAITSISLLRNPIGLAVSGVLTLILIFICWLKGEPPTRRRGAHE